MPVSNVVSQFQKKISAVVLSPICDVCT